MFYQLFDFIVEFRNSNFEFYISMDQKIT